MSVTFEQARTILAEYLRLDIGGDGTRVATWGWENDEVFVLAFDISADDSGFDEDEDEDEDAVINDPGFYAEDNDTDDDWGTPEDLQAMREHVRLIQAGWDPWANRPAEVPVVDKATGQLRWEIPPSLGEPVAPNLRPVGQIPDA